VGLSRRLAAIAISLMAITAASAAEYPLEPNTYSRPLLRPQPIAQWESEIGGRYWYSSGRTQIDFFNVADAPSAILSRLTYSNLQAHSGEVFGRAEHLSGFFIKGYGGGGVITGGNLQDEDFPPIRGGYSSTNSDQRDGRLVYGTVDGGWAWRSEGVKLGFFAGYLYWFEHVNAFGCTQTATNPFICGIEPIANSIQVISQETTWQGVRIGFNGEWRFGGGWIFSTDLAWIPFTWLNASDHHLLRADLGGPTPEGGGSFNNVQLEALLGYRFSNGFSLGLGGRYWRIDSSEAERQVLGLNQIISLKSERWGGFLQASYKFGELPPTRYRYD
jgi:hypothetical protein